MGGHQRAAADAALAAPSALARESGDERADEHGADGTDKAARGDGPLRHPPVVCPGAAEVARLHHSGNAIAHGATSEDLNCAATADCGPGWTALCVLPEPYGRGHPDGRRAYHSARRGRALGRRGPLSVLVSLQ